MYLPTPGSFHCGEHLPVDGVDAPLRHPDNIHVPFHDRLADTEHMAFFQSQRIVGETEDADPVAFEALLHLVGHGPGGAVPDGVSEYRDAPAEDAFEGTSPRRDDIGVIGGLPAADAGGVLIAIYTQKMPGRQRKCIEVRDERSPPGPDHGIASPVAEAGTFPDASAGGDTFGQEAHHLLALTDNAVCGNAAGNNLLRHGRGMRAAGNDRYIGQ